MTFGIARIVVIDDDPSGVPMPNELLHYRDHYIFVSPAKKLHTETIVRQAANPAGIYFELRCVTRVRKPRLIKPSVTALPNRDWAKKERGSECRNGCYPRVEYSVFAKSGARGVTVDDVTPDLQFPKIVLPNNECQGQPTAC
jgi:hypothetical protein